MKAYAIRDYVVMAITKWNSQWVIISFAVCYTVYSHDIGICPLNSFFNHLSVANGKCFIVIFFFQRHFSNGMRTWKNPHNRGRIHVFVSLFCSHFNSLWCRWNTLFSLLSSFALKMSYMRKDFPQCAFVWWQNGAEPNRNQQWKIFLWNKIHDSI